jgi:hypothetical protein
MFGAGIDVPGRLAKIAVVGVHFKAFGASFPRRTREFCPYSLIMQPWPCAGPTSYQSLQIANNLRCSNPVPPFSNLAVNQYPTLLNTSFFEVPFIVPQIPQHGPAEAG